MFWVDEIVESIVKNYPDKNSFLINDSLTPSGHAHIGSIRGVVIHGLVKKALEEKGKKAVFQFGFEDFDPMDGLPVYVDQSWEQYMGLPLNKVPAPDKKSSSFADQYATEFKNVFNGLGVEPEIYYGWDWYKTGKFNDAIKIVLDNASEIREIYKKVSGSDKGSDWYPFQVVCPKCGKIGTTKVTDWDGKEVTFKCEESLVTWARGCGYEGKLSPFNGNGKMPYKVEWPCKWYAMKIDIEGAGKDHSAAGGSRDVANHIYREVFKKEPPFDIPYEHFLIGGKKMSSSKGLGVTAKDMFDFLPTNILRFLFIRTRYKRAIEFSPGGETIPLLYDEYDRISKTYRMDPKIDLARSFYYSEIIFGKDQPEYLLRFSKIAYMLQMPRSDIMDYAKGEKGAELSEIEKKEIEDRVEIAKKWLEKFAPESYKFSIQEKLPEGAANLSSQQKEFLGKIWDLVESKDSWTGEYLHKEIHNIRKEMNIDPRTAFSSIYIVFIGKDSGPQAGWLLAGLDRNFVLKRLEEISSK